MVTNPLRQDGSRLAPHVAAWTVGASLLPLHTSSPGVHQAAVGVQGFREAFRMQQQPGPTELAVGKGLVPPASCPQQPREEGLGTVASLFPQGQKGLAPGCLCREG